MGITAVMKSIGLGVAVLIHRYGSSAAYNSRIRALGELGYIHLSIVVLSQGAFLLFLVNQEARVKLGLKRPDQALYKVVEDWKSPKKPVGYALLDDSTEAAGEFNRAGRGYLNYLEYLPGLLACVACAGSVYPFPTFVTSIAILLGRILFILGYRVSPKYRTGGFLVSMLGSAIIEGLALYGGFNAISSRK